MQICVLVVKHEELLEEASNKYTENNAAKGEQRPFTSLLLTLTHSRAQISLSNKVGKGWKPHT